MVGVMTTQAQQINRWIDRKQLEFRIIDCAMCDGSGLVTTRALCPECNGTGRVRIGIVVGAKVPITNYRVRPWQIFLMIVLATAVGLLIWRGL
jgi:RecJ-like exonuclease